MENKESTVDWKAEDAMTELPEGWEVETEGLEPYDSFAERGKFTISIRGGHDSEGWEVSLHHPEGRDIGYHGMSKFDCVTYDTGDGLEAARRRVTQYAVHCEHLLDLCRKHRVPQDIERPTPFKDPDQYR